MRSVKQNESLVDLFGLFQKLGKQSMLKETDDPESFMSCFTDENTLKDFKQIILAKTFISCYLVKNSGMKPI